MKIINNHSNRIQDDGPKDYREDDHSSVLECMGYSFSGHRNTRIDKITRGKLNAFVALSH